MRILLTGVSGYLGSVLAEHLSRVPAIERITGIDIAPPQSPLPSKVEFVQMDIRAPELEAAMAGHEVIVHTAFIVLWLAKMPKGVRDDINFNGIRNVAQAAVANKARHFIHASSVAAYEPELVWGKVGITEDTPVGKGESVFYYANGKAMAERTLNEILGPSGTTLTMFRPYFVVGPRNRTTVEFLRKSAARYRGRDPRLQYVHEDDVASAFVQAVTTEMPGVYSVVPDDWLLWSQVVKTVGRESAPALPVWFARLYAAIAWRFLGSPTHQSWIDATLADFTASNAKLRATGWSPRYTCEEALRSAL